MSEQVEIFEDMTPVEPMDVGEQGVEDPGMDTFDNPNPITEEKVEEQGQAQEGKKAEATEEKPDSDQVKQLDSEETPDKEDDKGTSDKSDLDKEEDKGEDKDSEEQTEEAKETPKGPSIRVKNGDSTVDIGQDATVKVKVNGKNEFVPMKELMSNYSGKVAYDEKFETLQSENRTLEREKEDFEARSDSMISDLKEVFNKINDPDGNPMDAITYLLDIAGKPVHTYMKRVMEHQLTELETLQEMDETEMNLYWMNKENDYLRNNQTTQAELAESQKTEEELTSRVSNLREKYGVSEDEFSDVRKELIERTGKEDVTPEDVVQYAKFKPLYSQAEGFVTDNFSDQLGDTDLEDLTAETARVMFTAGKASEDEAVRIAAKNLGYEIDTEDERIQELQDKVGQTSNIPTNVSKKVAERSEDHVESFDDFFNY